MNEKQAPIPQFGCRKQPEKIGILLAQLGTPDAPTTPALRRYLRQFLADRRVIELPRLFWLPLLYGVILWRRPQRSARLYRRIWTEQGSPLLTITAAQAEGLATRLKATIAQEGVTANILEVTFGMRYGNPSLESAVNDLISKHCSRILVLPMYPQYAAATTASSLDSIFNTLLKQRWVPTLRVVEPYYRSPHYVSALAEVINKHLASFATPPERLILSYHGIPLSYVEKGDPYCCMCSETSAALIPLIRFPKEHIIQTYQSRFGRAPWLTPYTDETVEHLAQQGIKRIAVTCPGFTTDCLETVDEIGTEAKEAFLEHGGEELYHIPCLNAEPHWLDKLSTIAFEEIRTWIERAHHDLSCMHLCPVAAAEGLSHPPFCSQCPNE